MSQPNLLELAKQGNAKAIATLLNRSLQPKGVTVKGSVKDGCLQLMLESEQIPDRQTIVPLIRKGLVSLQTEAITSVKVYGQQTGMATPSWNEKFELEKPQLVSPSLDGKSEIQPEEENIPSPEPAIIVKPVIKPVNHNIINTQVKDAGKPNYKDILEGLKIFAIDPVGGLPEFFASLGKQRALRVGIAFGIIYLVSILICFRQIPPMFVSSIGGGFKIVLFCIIQFVSIVGASYLARKLFRGNGSLEGDVFIAGASLLAPGIFLLLAGTLGIGNVEISLVLAVVCFVYTILTLYTGCEKISGISQAKSPLAVASMLIASTWISKIVIASLMLNRN